MGEIYLTADSVDEALPDYRTDGFHDEVAWEHAMAMAGELGDLYISGEFNIDGPLAIKHMNIKLVSDTHIWLKYPDQCEMSYCDLDARGFQLYFGRR